MSHSAERKLIGAVVIALGAWVAIVAYVGPAFGYPMPPGSDQPAWEWSASHTQRHLLPGIAAIVGGGLLWPRSRAAVLTGAWLALAAGAWFVLSPFIPRAWLDGGGGGGGDASTVMQIITPLGYHHVPGLLTVALTAFVLGRLLPVRDAHPQAAERAGVPQPAAREREPVGA